MHGHFDMESEETIVIEGENGTETSYTIDAIIEMNKNRYIIYSNGDQVFVSQLKQTDAEEFLEDVTNEELEELFNAYNEALEDEITK